MPDYSRACIRRDCNDTARTMRAIEQLLLPAREPGQDTVKTLIRVLEKAAEMQRQRNSYAHAVRQIHDVWAHARAGIVMADELASALYIAEEEIS